MKTLKSRQTGFTLLELMIVVAIIGILAAIAVPGYANYVTKTRITEATTALSDMRVEMEQFYQDNLTYVGGPCTTARNTDTFTIVCAATAATTYTITATGNGKMANYNYSINEANAKLSSTPNGGPGKACWAIKLDGGC